MTQLTITLPFPDHGLTKNRGNAFGNRGAMLGMIRKAHDATEAAIALYKYEQMLSLADFPLLLTEDVFLVIRCERKKRGQRWDHGGMTEAIKPYLDTLQGWFYANDRQIVGNLILWDEKPTGTGVIHMTFVPVEEAIKENVR